MRKSDELIGKKINKLTILDFSHKKDRHYYYLCKCDCGTIKPMRIDSIISNVVVSCGCFHKENNSKLNKGKKLSEEQKQKISKSNYGKKRSIESKLKMSESQKGKTGSKASHWNPNLTSEERLKRRNIPEHKEWRKKVYERDNYSCQICGKKGSYLNAHHIYPWRSYPHIRNTVWNGITLCNDCHNMTKNKESQVSYLFIPHLRKYME